MSKVTSEDLNEDNGKKLSAEELEQVKGGTPFMKLGDIEGDLKVAQGDKNAVAKTLIMKRTSR